MATDILVAMVTVDSAIVRPDGTGNVTTGERNHMRVDFECVGRVGLWGDR